MRPPQAPARLRNPVLETIRRYPGANPRIFGSTRGDDTAESDLDIVIDPDFATRNLQLELTTACAARNRCVHGYFAPDIEQMWVAAKTSAPDLASEARPILSARK